MILKDEQTGERYEVEDVLNNSQKLGIGGLQLVTIKPLDTKEEWPSYEDDYYFISTTGNVHCAAWGDTPDDRKLYECGNCYRTKEEAEQARDRIASIRDAEEVIVFPSSGEEETKAYLQIYIPIKYLKAWEALE